MIAPFVSWPYPSPCAYNHRVRPGLICIPLRNHLRYLPQWELVSSPRFLGNPFVHLPCSWTPPEPPLRLLKVWCCSRYHYDESFRVYLTFVARSHGFCTCCLRFALRSPYMRKTRFRSAANRFRTGLSPVGLRKRVSMCYMSPPSRLCLAPSNSQYACVILRIAAGVNGTEKFCVIADMMVKT